MNRPRPNASRAPRCDAGFSFLEMVVVMGILAVLMGMTVGVLTSTGAESLLNQAKAILTETAYKVKSNSEGGGRQAVLTIQKRQNEDGGDVLQVGALVALPVLTMQFETLDQASGNVLVQTHGGVQLAPGEGFHGAGARFERGGFLEIPARTRFAMTEGMQAEVRVRPKSAGSEVILFRAEDDLYKLSLFRKRDRSSYAVRFTLKVFSEGQGHRNATPEVKTFETEGSPVRINAKWQRIQVAYDGLEASIRVNGIEHLDTGRKKRRRDAALDEARVNELRTLAIPESGAVKVFISDPSSSFVGVMDSFKLRGVFRDDEMQRDLPAELDLLGAKVPVRVVYVNGRLDPDVHRTDVVLQLRDPTMDQGEPIELRLGLNGTIESHLSLSPMSSGKRKP